MLPKLEFDKSCSSRKNKIWKLFLVLSLSATMSLLWQKSAKIDQKFFSLFFLLLGASPLEFWELKLAFFSFGNPISEWFSLLQQIEIWKVSLNSLFTSTSIRQKRKNLSYRPRALKAAVGDDIEFSRQTFHHLSNWNN